MTAAASLIPVLLTLVPLPLVYVLLGLHDLLFYDQPKLSDGPIEMLLVGAFVLLLVASLLASPSIRRILSQRATRLACFALFPLMMLLTVVEAGCGIYQRVHFPPLDLFATDRLHSAVYQGVEWAPQIIEQQKKLKYEYAPIRLWKASKVDHPLLHINAEGYRETVNSEPADPQAPEFRVHVYGGSTVLCLEVPDSMTLPSYLSRELATRMPDRRVIVENFGMSGYVRSQELAYLTENFGKTPAPECVVIYDGGNDLAYPLWMGIPHSNYPEFIKTIEGEEITLPILVSKAFFYATNTGALIQRMHKLPPAKAPLAADEIQSRAAAYATSFLSQADFVRTLCHARGIQTAFFMQPMIYQKQEFAGREKAFMHYERTNRPGVDAMYAAFAAEVGSRESAAGHADFHDLTGILSDHKEEIFLDIIHVGPRSNEEIARAMADAILADAVPAAHP